MFCCRLETFVALLGVVFTITFFLRPETARRASIGVKEGDIILVGTDGLFDNLSEEMILHHVAEIKVTQQFQRPSKAKRCGLESRFSLGGNYLGDVKVFMFLSRTVCFPERGVRGIFFFKQPTCLESFQTLLFTQKFPVGRRGYYFLAWINSDCFPS